ncbi:MAG: hypothetical protein KF745_14610 [Phycisphaeraceae bacterium]|nr:hypothetical protein [Phycisphaeraceae bacterium]
MTLRFSARTLLGAFAAGACLSVAAPAVAQLRVATWNISNYGGGRNADLTTAIFAEFNGRSMTPDVIIALEFLNQSAVNSFLSILNAASGPGTWAAAPFIDGPDTDGAFFYRVSKVGYLGTTIVGYGSTSTSNQPRNTYRYDLRPIGYTSNAASIGCYAVHMKAQGGTNSEGRRLIESQRIRDNAEGQNAVNLSGQTMAGTGLPVGYSFLVAGDLNVQSATESFYAELIGSQVNNTGRFFDPIKTPASWNNNSAYRFVHTQDPAGAGGMDDRHDQILLSASLINGSGLDYIGNPNIAYSTTTWNDPNHSYRAWGNDGTSFDSTLTTTGNAMVGPAIAQALINVCAGAGHLPVFLDLRVPAKAASVAAIEFGEVALNAPASADLPVFNAGDVALWTAGGISDLHYSFDASSGFGAPAGVFIDAAGGGSNLHSIVMDTSAPGPKSGTLAIISDDPDQPVRIVLLSGTVTSQPPSCSADWDHDGSITPSDIAGFVNDWLASITGQTLVADFDQDQAITPSDLALFINTWLNQLGGGC